MVSNCTNEGKRFLLYKQIVDVSGYRTLCGLSDCTGKTLRCLKKQLAEPPEHGMDFWWSPVTDLELLNLKAVDDPLKVTVVTDGKSAIICELPDSIEESLFVEID